MRNIHRILGYLAIGMDIAYAISGIVLIHRTGDFMKHSSEVNLTLPAGMNADQLGVELKIKHFRAIDDTPELITFADGRYNKLTGEVTYVKKELVWPVNRLVELHKLPDAKNPHIAFGTTVFGIVLLLLAITSLLMYKPANKQFKMNMIYVTIGVALTVLLAAFA